MTQCGWKPTYANLSMLILGIITNYVVRKKIVFKG
jgi:putative flippase GtrA